MVVVKGWCCGGRLWEGVRASAVVPVMTRREKADRAAGLGRIENGEVKREDRS